MDESSNKKPKEAISNEEHSNGANLIDSLPDDILIEIFSLLPTVDAFRASFVSTEWRRLWKSIPVIDLNPGLISHKHGFVPFVNKLLELRDSDSTVSSLFVGGNFYRPAFADSIDSWIDFAVKRRTQSLRLHIGKEEWTGRYQLYKLPRRLFECRSLRRLNLVVCELNLRGPVDFPSLQMLSLVGVVLDSSVLNAVIAGSPRLSDLMFFFCQVHGGLRIEDSKSHLSRLHLSPRPYNEGKLVIRAPGLERFTMRSMASDGVSVIDSPNLRVVRLPLGEMLSSRYDLADLDWHSNLVDLLSDLSHAGSLHLSSWSLQVFTIWGRENLGPSHVVHWENLDLDVAITQWEIPGILYLLNTFSPVKNLTINFLGHGASTQILIDTPEFNANEFLRIEGLPLASLRHLETISLTGLIRDEDVAGEGPDELAVHEFLERRQHEIMLVKILLENSTELKQMTCICRLKNYLDRQELYSKLADVLSQKVQAFPRASPAAEVILKYE